jgi:site-specific DNA recombinase
LICVSDGIDSAHDGARMAFRFKAVMADEYLVDLGKKTLRGLQGAARRGTSTGGLPYGYASKPIWNGGREPEGYKILVDPDQQEIVVRIFAMYRDGHSFLSIAAALNKAGVPPPRAESKRHPTKFWKKGTIRELLHNPAYIGTWTFGKKKWRKDPVTRKRRYTKRDPNDVHVTERPHLEIVPRKLWDAVQAPPCRGARSLQGTTARSSWASDDGSVLGPPVLRRVRPADGQQRRNDHQGVQVQRGLDGGHVQERAPASAR